jgi:hypothetical protein
MDAELRALHSQKGNQDDDGLSRQGRLWKKLRSATKDTLLPGNLLQKQPKVRALNWL